MKLPTKQLHFDLVQLMLGEYLGAGVNRTVYRLSVNPRYVIKCSTEGHSWQNINEWEAWWYCKGKPIQKWLAPCHSISPTGIYLIQEYIEPVRKDELPKTLPRLLVDQKQCNFGMRDTGQLVARDYGTMVSLVAGITGSRKADWGDSGYDGVTIK